MRKDVEIVVKFKKTIQSTRDAVEREKKTITIKTH